MVYILIRFNFPEFEKRNSKSTQFTIFWTKNFATTPNNIYFKYSSLLIVSRRDFQKEINKNLRNWKDLL